MLQILLMILLFIAITYIYGLIYVFIGNFVSKEIQRNFGWKGFCIFGAIGVPFHEFTHWIMCKLFLHKVTKVEFFRPKKGKEDHVLGYVEHEYKKTKFRQMGNFFIGAAPMMLGTGLIILLFRILYPEAFEILEPLGLNIIGFKEMIANSMKFLLFIFKSSNIFSWKFLVFILFLIAISAHIDMSWVDIKGSLSGVPLFIIISFILSIYIGRVIGFTLLGTAGALAMINIYYLYFLTIGAIINLIIGFAFYLIYKLRGGH